MSGNGAKAALEVFEAALDVPIHERAGWVERKCGHDAELAAEVHSLLAAHGDAQRFPRSAGHRAPFAAIRSFVPNQFRYRTGRQLGDFLIEQQIGAGGMGLVFRARQISLNRPVALKVLPPHLRYSESARLVFNARWKRLPGCAIANIVAVYTTGEEHGTAYFAMELIDGPALSQLIDELRCCPLPEVAIVPIGCLAGLPIRAQARIRAPATLRPLPAVHADPHVDLGRCSPPAMGTLSPCRSLMAAVAERP